MTQPTVTLYTKDLCQQCNATKRKFAKEGIDYTVIDCSAAYGKSGVATPEAVREAEQVVAAIKELGYQQLPVVVVTAPPGELDLPDIHWSGYNPDLIMAHCRPV